MRFENSMFDIERDDDGIVVVTMDDETQSANTMNERFQRELPELVAHLESVRETTTGIVIASAKKTFFAGGDLGWMMAMTRDDAGLVERQLDLMKAALRRLETIGRPVVSVIDGAALGGGFEIALASHRRIATRGRGVVVGLPEVTLGLLPGAGGTTRTVRMFGLLPALQDILLPGRKFSAQEGLDAGLLDELVDDASQLVPAARAWILAGPDPTQPWDRPGYEIPGGRPDAPGVARELPMLPAQLRKKSNGSPIPAQINVLAAAVEGAQVDFDGASRIESRYCADLMTGPISKNIITSTFFDMQSIKRGGSRPEGYPQTTFSKLVVLGAGMMGAGIAYVAARAGIDVVLKDVAIEAAERGKSYSARVLEKEISRGRLTEAERDAVLARIHPTVDAADAQGADILIEAVFENPELKKSVIAEVVPYLAEGALISSNTSSLPITDLASAVDDPGRFIGLHFFSPVDRMALLEIVVGAGTSDATTAKAVDFAAQIKKTPIVVSDGRGFYTTRVILRYVDEAIALVGEGVPAASVEQAALQAGYPVGPLALVDELTLTLLRHIREETIRGEVAEGLTPVIHPANAVVDRMIDEFDRKGRSGGAGFYEYADGAKRSLWPGLAEAFGADDPGVPFEDMQERMLFIEALDSIACLDSGVLRTVADANIGSLLGIGYPGWTGGTLQYASQYEGGLAGFVARSRELAARYGERFEPPASLVALAEAGGTYR
ncbi:3-hydroxyacyl-CoA dehydrogenase NAD-binding domain-containing protein [Microbacterium sp. No. 7]|uniref:3-hydroxyacyl-CoA dehydrogenase NAD-binding domain-containing protein n=1 Tax=Microbacterium sp. No. 7 TaxID=1714373 RepID=UPI0006D0074A|nr:3-hydroxyacyl-CoA dehydrogenase NAD-binding domain-containing protein [Microbacterium sp. No. 7]ALJ21875.1 3-hydroxyacyl-CoA dehydrogenase [Microbacterium sp. No. 7]